MKYGYSEIVWTSASPKPRTACRSLIRAVEQGESVVITHRGKPVAQLTTPPPKRRRVIFGGMKDRINSCRVGRPRD